MAPTTLDKAGVKLVRPAHGLMRLSFTPVEDSVAFASIKASLDHAGPGEKVVLNSADFYGFNPPTANLEMLSRFFTESPEYREKAFLVVKGAFGSNRQPALDPDSIRKSVTNIRSILGSNKTMDVFETARLDDKHSVEEVVASMKALQEEGLVDYIGLSEVGADTLRKACEVAPIVTLEIEVSPWSYDKNVQDAIAAAGELGVTVLAYAPIGRGFLTGNITPENLDAKSLMRMYPRFKDEAMIENKKIVDKISEIAGKKGITNAQLCIAWVASLGEHVIPLPGSSNVDRTMENFASDKITFTPEEKKEIDDAVASFQVVGERYPETQMAFVMK
ncbi:aldo/keto reductase [Clavulina sp. PMI_390]|nr:aldo/keto reductase [Clavulina sp. PMI_390]